MTVHLVKVCVGISSIEQLRSSQARRLIAGPICHVTKQRPQREAELLDGGSLYWIIKGHIAVRQRVVELERLIDHEGEKCGLVLDSELVETELVKRGPHQAGDTLKPLMRREIFAILSKKPMMMRKAKVSFPQKWRRN
nr:DUF1489 family protein [Sneathiella glossodoripedis]